MRIEIDTKLMVISETYRKTVMDLPIIAYNERIEDDRRQEQASRDNHNWLMRCKRKMDAVYDFYNGIYMRRSYSWVDFIKDALIHCGTQDVKWSRKGCTITGTRLRDTPEELQELLNEYLGRQQSFITGANKGVGVKAERPVFIEKALAKTSVKIGYLI